MRGRIRTPAVLAVAVLVLVVGALVGVRALTGPGTYQVSATFSEMPGVYPGNAVKVLGVRVGKVLSVDPGVDGVRVRLEIDEQDRLPADVRAFLMAPNAVNDRFIELAPAYSGSGPKLPDGGQIAPDHTAVPQSVDQIIDNLDRFARLMGPEGANAHGSLSRMLAALADTLGGQGGTVHQLVRNLGTTLTAVGDQSTSVTAGLNDLGDLTTAAASVSGTYRRLAENLSAVSSGLATDAPQITAVLTNLQDLLAQLNTFVKDNKDQLGNTISSLSGVASEVGKRQQALTQLMRSLPLAVSNVGNAIVTTKQGTALRARLDPVRGAKVRPQVCGDGLLRLMAVALEKDPSARQVLDLVCGVDRWLDELSKPAGTPAAPPWTMHALQGLGG